MALSDELKAAIFSDNASAITPENFAVLNEEDRFEALQLAASGGGKKSFERIIALTPEAGRSPMIHSGDNLAFRHATQNGHFTIANRLFELEADANLRNAMVHSKNDEAFRATANPLGNLPILACLLKWTTDETLLSEMIHSENDEAFKGDKPKVPFFLAVVCEGDLGRSAGVAVNEENVERFKRLRNALIAGFEGSPEKKQNLANETIATMLHTSHNLKLISEYFSTAEETRLPDDVIAKIMEMSGEDDIGMISPAGNRRRTFVGLFPTQTEIVRKELAAFFREYPSPDITPVAGGGAGTAVVRGGGGGRGGSE